MTDMFRIVDGKMLLKNGKLATGQACCCGEPCDPCSNYFGAPEYQFPASRMAGTWDINVYGDSPVAFDWLAPAGPYVWLNAGWENNSRPPVGMAAVAPFVRINSTLWRWDGSTETCNTYVDVDGFPEVAEGEVPAIRTCGGPTSCQAWGAAAYEYGGPESLLSVREYRTLIENPPPSDNRWYIFLWIEAFDAGPIVWHWAWIPACQDLCGEEVSLTRGVAETPGYPGFFDDFFKIDTFTITCEAHSPCCTGNAEYPVYEQWSVCAAQGGHNLVGYSAQQSPSSTPPCLGACCFNNGTDDVCGDMMTLALCNSLGGTWHSGQDCFTDPCNLFP